MPRYFNNTSEYIKLSIGSCGITSGAITIAAIVRFAADNAWEDIVVGDNGSNTDTGFVLKKSDNLGAAVNALYFSRPDSSAPSDSWSAFTLGVSDKWVLVAVTCAAGASTPRFHKYVFSTQAWIHSAGNQALGSDSSVSPTQIILGEGLQSSDSMSGDIASAAIWNRELSDGEIEMLCSSYANWALGSPSGSWILNQQSTSIPVYDLTGNGANETAISGTAVSNSIVPFVKMKAATIRPAAFSPGMGR